MGILDDALKEGDDIERRKREYAETQRRDHDEAVEEIASLSDEFAQIARSRGFPTVRTKKLPVAQGWLIPFPDGSEHGGRYCEVLVSSDGRWWWVEARSRENFLTGTTRVVYQPTNPPSRQLPGAKYVQETMRNHIKFQISCL